MSRSSNNDICAQIGELIRDLSSMSAELTAESEKSAKKAAVIIANEQRRIFQKANFKHDKKSYDYKNAGYGLIGITEKRTGRARIKYQIGFDTDTLRLYPELIEIEFGRPGKSSRHSKGKDSIGRKKGKFPESATVMPIRTGFYLAKEKAVQAYADDMLDKVQNRF